MSDTPPIDSAANQEDVVAELDDLLAQAEALLAETADKDTDT